MRCASADSTRLILFMSSPVSTHFFCALLFFVRCCWSVVRDYSCARDRAESGPPNKHMHAENPVPIRVHIYILFAKLHRKIVTRKNDHFWRRGVTNISCSITVLEGHWFLAMCGYVVDYLPWPNNGIINFDDGPFMRIK